MFEGWQILVAFCCGALVGAALTPLTRYLLNQPATQRFLFSHTLGAVATGMLWALVWWRLGHRPDVAVYLVFAAASIPLIVIDLVEQRLPRILVLPLYPILAGVLLTTAITTNSMGALLRAVIGMAVVFGFCFIVAIVTRGGLGAGDVRLSGVLGLVLAWLNWTTVITGLLAGLMLAGVYGAVLVVLRQGTRQTRFPLGPFLLAGTLIAMIGANL